MGFGRRGRRGGAGGGAAHAVDVSHMERLPLERVGHGGRRGHKSRHRDFEHIMETFPDYEKGLEASEKVSLCVCERERERERQRVFACP